jgi:nitrogen-specific signal transduction histidine kinase
VEDNGPGLPPGDPEQFFKPLCVDKRNQLSRG